MTSSNPLVGNLSSPLSVLFFLPFFGPATAGVTAADHKPLPLHRLTDLVGKEDVRFPYFMEKPLLLLQKKNKCWSTYVKTGIESFSHFCFRSTWPRSNDAVFLLPALSLVCALCILCQFWERRCLFVCFVFGKQKKTKFSGDEEISVSWLSF